MKFRKKPVVVDAIQWNGLNVDEVLAFCVTSAAPKIVNLEPMNARMRGLIIKTLEGDMRADSGDWIIKGIKGEVYPCKPDIFEATYERVE